MPQELDNLVKIGQLKAEPGDQAELDGLIRFGETRFTDARNTAISIESRFTLAYDAAHAFSLAALRWHGYRPDQSRYIVFQCLPHTLALKKELVRILTKAHEQRNLAEYRGQFIADEQLLSEVLRAAALVKSAVQKLGPVPHARS
jgi:hypothetical protein